MSESSTQSLKWRPLSWRRFAHPLVEPVDPASVAVFRILFGTLLGIEALRYLRNGWILRYSSDTPAFLEGLWNAPLGELQGPVRSNAGWVLFRRER